MKIALMDYHEGAVTAVTQQQWDVLGAHSNQSSTPKSEKKTPHVHRKNVPAELQHRLDGLLEKHHKLWDGELLLMKATEHRLVLKPGAKPIRLNPYRMGPRSRELTRKEVQRMMDRGVIETSSSECANPVDLVPKPDGTVRFCIDYQRLIELTVKDSYLLHRIEDCLDSLGEAAFFSTLDCNAGCWQLPVSPKDRHLTKNT